LLRATRDAASTWADEFMSGVDNTTNFVKIHDSASCCRWRCRRLSVVKEYECSGHGTAIGALGGADHSDIFIQHPGVQSIEPGEWSAPGLTAGACQAACAVSARCAHFSINGQGTCVFCSACELRQEPGWASWSRLPVGQQFQPTSSIIGPLLEPIVQANYSKELYGARGRVPVKQLRLVWLELLPRRALQLIARSGVCKWESKPPFHPFYVINDMKLNPLMSMWVHQSATLPPAPSRSWVEVLHCPNQFKERHKPNSTELVEAPWKLAPAWFYVAPGSGVSINIGRTLVVESWTKALLALSKAFAHLSAHELCDSRFPLSPKAPLSRVDSLQVIGHREYFSREPRHEIVMLRHHECAPLTAATPGVLCGRPPYLMRCKPKHPGLRGMSRCDSFRRHEYGPKDSHVRRAMKRSMSRFGRRSPCSSSGCYTRMEPEASHFMCPVERG
jgi:hypothetical protein